jgi:hypothetical protein
MKIERNETCPCGSNKKYKKCCYLKQSETINKPHIMRNRTGELFHPVRLHYEVSDKKEFLNILKQLKCIDADITNRRFIWLYADEAKKLTFPNAYNKIPKQFHPIVIGSFFESKSRNDEVFLDVRSHERASQAVAFFDNYIPSKYAKITHASLTYRLVEDNQKNLTINFDKLFPDGHADKQEEERSKLNAKLTSFDPKKESILTLLESTHNKIYPETDKIKLSYYEDGPSMLNIALQISSTVALERMNGNEMTHKDVMDKITDSVASSD